MEQRRRQYASEVRLQIIRLEKSQQRDSDILENITKIGLSQDMVIKKRRDIEDNMNKRVEEIFQLEQREQEYLSGRLDKEKIEKYKNGQQVDKNRRNDIIEKHKKFVKEEEIMKEKIGRRQTKENEDKYIEKNYNYYYRQFCKAEETLPNYIRANLDDMPNNKGYIWRGCWFMGNKKREYNSPLIMFEKQKGGILCINEIDDYEHRLYKKRGKERKVLVSREYRKYRVKSLR